MIIQIRGTSGSGKTWVIKNILDKYEFKPIVNSKSEIQGYYSKEVNLFIVGKYETACGGCDSIKTQDEIVRRIKRAYSKNWNIVFEGLICSHIARRYAELYLWLKERDTEVKFIFLSTPLEKCKKNINKRRIEAGKPPTVAKNTEKDYLSTQKSRENMNGLGVSKKDMPMLSSKEALEYICSRL